MSTDMGPNIGMHVGTQLATHMSPSQSLAMPETPARSRWGRFVRGLCTVVAFIVFSLLGG